MTNNVNSIEALLASEPEEGTVAHKDWLADISRMEREAWAKGQASMFSGSAGNMSVYQSVQHMPQGPISSSDRDFKGAMAHGEGISLPDGLIQIGDFRTDMKTAEMMRQNMTPTEWMELTGRPYAPVMGRMEREERGVETKRPEPTKAEEPAKIAEPDMSDPEELATQVVEPTLLEQVVDNMLGSEIRERVSREVAETGELSAEHREKLGITEEMFNDAVASYIEQADRILKPVNSSSEIMSEFLSDKEAANARKALLNRDISGFRRYGEIAAQRLSQMTVAELSEWMTPEEKRNLKLTDGGNGVAVIDLPKVGRVYWSTAVTQGWVKL